MSFRDKPLQARKRIATITTGTIGIILIVVMIFTYAHPRPQKHDLEQGIMGGYTTFINKIQSLFQQK